MSLPLLAELPAALQPLVSRNATSLRNAVAAVDGLSLDDWNEQRWAEFARVATASDFVLEQSVRDPAMLLALAASGELDRAFAAGELCAQVAGAAQAAGSEDELARNLRRQRTRQQVRIIWRDLTRQADLVQTCRDLSDLADAAIDQAYQWLYPRLCAQFGTPTGNRSAWTSTPTCWKNSNKADLFTPHTPPPKKSRPGTKPPAATPNSATTITTVTSPRRK